MKESIFDRITAKTEDDALVEGEKGIREGQGDRTVDPETSEPKSNHQDRDYTPEKVKAAVQELLKYGILEADRKPNLYETVMVSKSCVNRILEPLDLSLKMDEVRGLAFLKVAEQESTTEDGWKHPLVRRQRLTLEQSLLIAILRQQYIVHEQEVGIGAGDARVDLEEILPQLQTYLGDPGSDVQEEKRLRNLLDKLKVHGIVSEVDSKDQFTIRPLITHLANPETLRALLLHFKENIR